MLIRPALPWLFGIGQLVAGAIVLGSLLPYFLCMRGRGFRFRFGGWAAAVVVALAGSALLAIGVTHLTGTVVPRSIRVPLVASTVAVLPIVLGVLPSKWLLSARPNVREPVLTAHALLELGKLAPENGERAFQKAFDLYNQATIVAPQSVAATYGCGLALYELAQVTSSPAREDLVDRARHWFARALDLDPKPELRRFLADLDEYRASMRDT